MKRFSIIDDDDKRAVRANLKFWIKVLRENTLSYYDTKNIEAIVRCLKSFPLINEKINSELSAVYTVKFPHFDEMLEITFETILFRDVHRIVNLTLSEHTKSDNPDTKIKKYGTIFHTSIASKVVSRKHDAYDGWHIQLDEILLFKRYSNYKIETFRN